jgi:hypothetical protein
VGTSYTLNLMALLTTPLAFTFFNFHDTEGEPTADPIALLEALRRHAERITLFCQAGAIAVPQQNRLLAYLEKSVVETKAPLDGGIFHPKVWLLRFIAEGEPVRYRLLCLSRNLTFDRAWDTCLALEGAVAGKASAARNRPLADFIRKLPQLGVRHLAKERRDLLEKMASELQRVTFEPPAPFKSIRFHPLGFGKYRRSPLPDGARYLVLSPHLTIEFLRGLSGRAEVAYLISRHEELARMDEALLPEDGTFVLSPGADMESQEVDEPAARDGEVQKEAKPKSPPPPPAPELSGLHAKLFLAEKGHHAHLFTGSANATTAGFGRNVEFLVELVAGKWNCGIENLLGKEDDRVQDSLRSLLEPYTRLEEEPDESDDRALELELDRFAMAIAGSSWIARVTALAGSDSFDLSLHGELPDLPETAKLAVWPATLPRDSAQAPSRKDAALALFAGVTFDALTAFWAFEIELTLDDKRAHRRFAVVARLEGAPEDREQRILRSLLTDQKQVLRLLLLLLASEDLDASQLVAAASSNGDPSAPWVAAWDEPTFLESLLVGLSRSPQRLDHVARLIEDLRQTEEGRALLPPDLEALWDPVWKVRQETSG